MQNGKVSVAFFVYLIWKDLAGSSWFRFEALADPKPGESKPRTASPPANEFPRLGNPWLGTSYESVPLATAVGATIVTSAYTKGRCG
jgi:hypothetical protein